MSILIKPVVTEKMTDISDKSNRYGFVVKHTANKIEIKKAVESMYGVTVESINTMVYAGKSKSKFTKTGLISGRTNKYKKAIVTVSEGDVIDYYSNI